MEPINISIDPGVENSCHQAAYKLIQNHENVIKFAVRGAGEPGKKQFQAPLADPYAVPNLNLYNDMDSCLRLITLALLNNNNNNNDYTLPKLTLLKEVSENSSVAPNVSEMIDGLIKSTEYLQKRIGVPRDMSYPAARQFRAYLTWLIENQLEPIINQK